MDDFARRAYRAYEYGRWVRAFRSATATLSLLGIAFVVHAPSWTGLGLGFAALGFHIVAHWYHRDLHAGIWMGFGLGAAQVAASIFMRFVGMKVLPGSCDAICMAMVFSASAFVGFFGYTRILSLRGTARGGAALVAIGLGGSLVVLGCAPGAAGLVFGSILGLVLGGVPSWMWMHYSGVMR